MTDGDGRSGSKRSVYFTEGMLEEIAAEAQRLERSPSWVVQRAWLTARQCIKKIPRPSGKALGDPAVAAVTSKAKAKPMLALGPEVGTDLLELTRRRLVVNDAERRHLRPSPRRSELDAFIAEDVATLSRAFVSTDETRSILPSSHGQSGSRSLNGLDAVRVADRVDGRANAGRGAHVSAIPRIR